jgi:hypothetical protein
MSLNKIPIPMLALALMLVVGGYLLNHLGYVVWPEGVGQEASAESKGWSAVATSVGQSEAGALRIELAIRNETADWSAMEAVADKPAVLTNNGQTTHCDTVFVSTGGHRLAPGFQIRGFTAGTKAEPLTQLLYVECAGAEASPGSKLSIDYSYVTGQYNYYEKDANKVDTKLEVDLDQIAAEQTYPIARSSVEGLIQKPEAEIIALNDVVLTLTGVTRTDTGLLFTWQTSNPGEYASYVHIGNPPVVGEDGIFYGFYETPDIVSAPITPASGKVEWTTEVAVPKDVKGIYIMLSVETGKARLFANYAIDITDK